MATSVEDDAALYDRQIRLWGWDAQKRMRASSVLLVTLRGIAVEVAKNIVLAGIGSITLLDPEDVVEEDLGANFFLREDDVGRKRVEAAAPRVQALNPRVDVLTCTEREKLEDEQFLSTFDLIVVTECDAPSLLQLNALTRKLGKKMLAAASIGMDGWIFADLLEHEYMVDEVKTLGGGETVTTPTKYTLSYPSFAQALTHRWEGVKGRAMRRISKSLWTTLTLFSHQTAQPSLPPTAESLAAEAQSFLPTLFVDPALLTPEILSRIARTTNLEFPPTTAILGGLVGQDVLNTLGGKQKPIHNFMIFEGDSGAGDVFSLGVK